ncbi:MAG: P-type conjugative transfer protein TrbL [Candidatus Binataceae bacterium]
MDPNTIGAQFTSAAAAYAAAIQPYAAKLFFALLFIEVLVTAIQYMIDQGDAPRYLGRTFRHLLSAGFLYLMLVNAFPWMTAIIHSFGAIGSAVSGIPDLNPSTVLSIGGRMAETIFNAPTNPGGVVSDLGLALGETVAGFFVLLSFAIIAALALLVVVEAYLVIGGASILLAFGGSRFTAPIAEGYFGYVIKVGVRLLFFYLMIGVGIRIATGWNAALTAACLPTTVTLPWYATYGVPPTKIIAAVCSAPLSMHLLLMLVANSIVLLIITTVVPSTAAGIVSGTVGLALNHAFEAAFIAKTIISPMSSIMQSSFNKAIRAFGGNDGSLEARLRANERIAPPKPPENPAKAPTAVPYGSQGDPSTGTRVMDPKLTRPMVGSSGRPSGISTTTQIGSNGSGKGTTNIGAGSTKGTTKI